MTEIVQLAAADLAIDERFRQVAREAYRDDDAWASAAEGLIAERCAAAMSGDIVLDAALALDRGRPVARAAAIVEPGAVDPAGRSEGWIGLVECLPDHLDAGVALLRERSGWLAQQGFASVAAPRTDPLLGGLVVQGHGEPQVLLTPHNPPCYSTMLCRAGFTVESEMLGYRFDRDRAPVFRVPPGLGLVLRSIDPSDWEGEVARLHAFQESVFADRRSRGPRRATQTRDLVRRLGPMIDPDLILVAEDRAGEVVGMLISLPDLWQARPAGARPTRARLLSIAVGRGWRGRGAALAMAAELASRLIDRGYQVLEGSWIRRDNVAAQRLAHLVGGVPTRTIAYYRCDVRGRIAG